VAGSLAGAGVEGTPVAGVDTPVAVEGTPAAEEGTPPSVPVEHTLVAEVVDSLVPPQEEGSLKVVAARQLEAERQFEGRQGFQVVVRLDMVPVQDQPCSQLAPV
jgi:hypothetical protein